MVETASECLDNAAVSASNSVPPASEDSVVSEISNMSLEAPAVAGQPSRDLGVDKHVAFPTQVEGESITVDALHDDVSPSGIPKIRDLQEKFPHACVTLSASSTTPASMSYESEKMTAAESVESAEESLLSHEYILVGSLNHAEGSQVINVCSSFRDSEALN